MSKADDFNEAELKAGRIKPSHITTLTSRFQAEQGLAADGKLGPKTRAMAELLHDKVPGDVPGVVMLAPLEVRDGWLVGAGVTVIPIHASWYYKRLSTHDGKPGAIVAHYTATRHGTAVAMAKNRANPIQADDRKASWHVSIDGDGSIVQMAPFTAGCWHAGGKTDKPISGLGDANHTAIGVELVGYGDSFPPAQVDSACRVWRALVQGYAIPHGRAMVTHQEIDPTRKVDPGPLWMGTYASNVLTYAYMSV